MARAPDQRGQRAAPRTPAPPGSWPSASAAASSRQWSPAPSGAEHGRGRATAGTRYALVHDPELSYDADHHDRVNSWWAGDLAPLHPVRTPSPRGS
ncbi:hypothetical protein [Modestobacter altitudinis]|uniref:hypothetical protein n=1 Tax=Modestobacter altitudinis TaxID=2213158 RepID=UPI00110CEEB7|nr:hypothetical protein [Modestobacter altitudinis]